MGAGLAPQNRDSQGNNVRTGVYSRKEGWRWTRSTIQCYIKIISWTNILSYLKQNAQGPLLLWNCDRSTVTILNLKMPNMAELEETAHIKLIAHRDNQDVMNLDLRHASICEFPGEMLQSK